LLGNLEQDVFNNCQINALDNWYMYFNTNVFGTKGWGCTGEGNPEEKQQGVAM